MSRVEDDRQAQRAAERLVQEKRLQEAKTKQKQEGESAFSKLVQQQTQQARTQQQQQGLAKSVLARVTQEAESAALGKSQTEQRGEAGRSTLRQAGKSFDERVTQQRGESGQRTTEGRQTDSTQTQMMAEGRQNDQGLAEVRAESRWADAKTTNEALDERGEALSKGGQQAGGAQASRGKGELKAEADGGGGKQGGGEGKKDGGGAEMAAAGFRFNPALMAPVPVAKPKPASGSERLRQIANEIAQKIVERARVGTNAAGNAEFQIDLRSDVLSGLSIKLSAKNGKIKAVFSGSDKDVLKMLEEQSEGLKSALASRGLTLEDLRIEARA
jgi:hypothetical protein